MPVPLHRKLQSIHDEISKNSRLHSIGGRHYGVVGIVVAACYWTISGVFQGESFFKGRPTSYWDRELDSYDGDRQKIAQESLRAGGVKALPVIQQLLRNGSERGAGFRQKVIWGCPTIPEAIPILSDALQRERSLGSAEPEMVQRPILNVLEAIGPPAKDAIPVVLTWLDGPMWYHATNALQAIDPTLAARTIIRCDNNFSVRAAAFAPDGQSMAIMGNDIRIWKVGTGEFQVLSNEQHPYHWRLLGGFSPDGKYLLASDSTEEAYLFDTTNGEKQKLSLGYLIDERLHRPESIDTLSWDDQGNVAVIANSGLILFDPKRQSQPNSTGTFFSLEGLMGKPIERLKYLFVTRKLQHPLRDWNAYLDCTPDGRIGASFGLSDVQVELWNLEEDLLLGTLEHHEPRMIGVNSVAFCAGGRLLATVGWESVKIWDVSSKTVLASYPFVDRTMQLSVSPDGNTLAGINQTSGTIRLWNLAPQLEKNDRSAGQP